MDGPGGGAGLTQGVVPAAVQGSDPGEGPGGGPEGGAPDGFVPARAGCARAGPIGPAARIGPVHNAPKHAGG